MLFHYFNSMILGNSKHGQGIKNAVEAMHRETLRARISGYARRLSLRGSWRSAGFAPAGLLAILGQRPLALATCPCSTATRRQRGDVAAATMSGVVVDPGTVGVC